MPSKSDLAQTYLTTSMANDIDAALAVLTDDVVLNRPMLGAVSGKAAVEEAMRSRPPGMGGMVPTFEPPVESGEQVMIKGNLPPGSPFPISSLTWTFSFEGEKISKIDIGL